MNEIINIKKKKNYYNYNLLIILYFMFTWLIKCSFKQFLNTINEKFLKNLNKGLLARKFLIIKNYSIIIIVLVSQTRKSLCSVFGFSHPPYDFLFTSQLYSRCCADIVTQAYRIIDRQQQKRDKTENFNKIS